MQPHCSSAIVSELYLAAYSGSGWNRVADRIARVACPDAKVGLRVVPHRPLEEADGCAQGGCSESLFGHAGFSEDALKAYVEYYHDLNFYNPILRDLEQGGMAATSDFAFDLATAKRSAFYCEYMQPHDIGFAGIGINSVPYRDGFVALTINYPEKAADMLDRRMKTILTEINDQLAHAVQIATHTAGRARLGGVMATLATHATPALALNEVGRVVGGNAAAEVVLAEGPIYLDRLQCLRSNVPAVDEALRSSVRAVLGPSRRPTYLRASDYGALGDLVLNFVPLPDDPEGAQHWTQFLEDTVPVALVNVMCDAVEPAGVTETLRAAYDLTELEARVAYAMYRGVTPAVFAASEALSLGSVGRVRQLVYERMKAHNDADVVRRVARLAPFVRSKGDMRTLSRRLT